MLVRTVCQDCCSSALERTSYHSMIISVVGGTTAFRKRQEIGTKDPLDLLVPRLRKIKVTISTKRRVEIKQQLITYHQGGSAVMEEPNKLLTCSYQSASKDPAPFINPHTKSINQLPSFLPTTTNNHVCLSRATHPPCRILPKWAFPEQLSSEFLRANPTDALELFQLRSPRCPPNV